MILTEAAAHIGGRVAYAPPGIPPGHALAEEGTIMSTNRVYVFVLYDNHSHAMATHASDLTALSW